MNNRKSEIFNKIFNAFVLIGMTVATIIATGIKLGAAESGRVLLIIAAAGSLCGVLANVLSANGRLLTFLFGLIDVTIYGVVCLFDTKYGNAALHLLYFLPMQVIGFVQWKKRGATEGSQVHARRLDRKKWLLYGSIFFVGLVAAYLVLCALDKTEAANVIRWVVLMDALSMMCNILGQYLLSTAYMEQWIFWIGVNIASVVMWALTLKQTPGSSYALIYLVKYSFYLINSLNGLRIWLALSRPNAAGGPQE